MAPKDARPPTTQYVKFNSLAEIIAHVDSLPHGAEEDHDNYWALGCKYHDARKLALHGWRDGVAQASALASRLADRVVSSPSLIAMSEEVTYDVTGASYDVGAYLSGEPECWQVCTSTETKKGVRIVCNVVASAAISADVLMRRGIAIAALVMSLQSQGYVLTLDVGHVINLPHGNPDGSRWIETMLVRVVDGDSGSQLDLDRIVFALAHPAFMRCVLSMASQGYIGHTGNTRWGCGVPCDTISPDAGKYDLYLGGVHLRDVERWQDGGEAWILAEYKRQTKAS